MYERCSVLKNVPVTTSGGTNELPLHPVVMDVLPNVAGRMQCSNLDFERRCRLYLQYEFERVDADSVLYSILCDGVRLAREYSESMQARP